MAKQLIVPKKEVLIPRKLEICKTFHSRMQLDRHAKQIGKRLVSHSTLNEGIMGGKGRISGNSGNLPICAAEVIAYAAPGESFAKGFDIVDPKDGTRIPWSLITNFDVLGGGKALIITPKSFERYRGGGKAVVIPESVIVIGGTNKESFMQHAVGVAGVPHKETMVPLAATPREVEKLPRYENLIFSRLPRQAVVTLSRTPDSNYMDARRHVLATLPLSHDYGAVLEVAPKKESPPAAWQPDR